MIKPEEFENLVSRSISTFLSEEENANYFRHNLTYFLQVNAARKIANEQPVAFDFRADYWWRPEVRIGITFFNDYFQSEFYPPTSVRKVLFEVAKHLQSEGKKLRLQSEGVYKTPETFRNDVKAIRKIIEKGIPGIEQAEKTIFEENRKLSKHGESITALFCSFLDDLAAAGEWQKMDSTFFKRIRFLHYFTAEKEEHLVPHARFFAAWYTLLTSTNAYQAGGAAQNMGPIFGNSKALDLLSTINKWSEGHSLLETRFFAHDAWTEEATDRSGYTAVMELYGFCRLISLPIVNKSVLDQYRSNLKIDDDDDNVVLQEKLGKAFSRSLEKRQIREFAMRAWDDSIEAAIGQVRSTVTIEDITNRDIKEKFAAELFHVSFERELQEHARNFIGNLTVDQREQVALQLTVDAELHTSHRKGKTTAIPAKESKSSPGSRSNGGVERFGGAAAIESTHLPLNQILFGPPGTGKTYQAIYRAIEIVDGHSFSDEKTEQQRRAKAMQRFNTLQLQGQVEVVTFHPGYAYEDFIEGISPILHGDSAHKTIAYEIRVGAFMRLCERILDSKAGVRGEAPRHVLIIDEINRGNLARIFGELITLIESDKRLGAENEIKVQLPFSKKPFGVPKELYIIGTMNTADRSLALMDSALRRRFEFERIAPNMNLVPEVVAGIPLRSIVKDLNERIAGLVGEDLELGHAYFTGSNSDSLSALRSTWFKRVLPLLQEYVYGDGDKFAQLVGRFAEEVPGQSARHFSSKRFKIASSTMSDEEFSIRILELHHAALPKAG